MQSGDSIRRKLPGAKIHKNPPLFILKTQNSLSGTAALTVPPQREVPFSATFVLPPGGAGQPPPCAPPIFLPEPTFRPDNAAPSGSAAQALGAGSRATHRLRMPEKQQPLSPQAASLMTTGPRHHLAISRRRAPVL
ncbi:MAG: hypothetical protein OXC07_05420 [Kistimonas sp.]|nr:hypothetical protein [Kistimonas sp.]